MFWAGEAVESVRRQQKFVDQDGRRRRRSFSRRQRRQHVESFAPEESFGPTIATR